VSGAAGAELEAVDVTAKLIDCPAIFLGWSTFCDGSKLKHCFAILGGFVAQHSAFLGLTIERLCDCRGTPDMAEKEDLYVKDAGLVGYAQHIADSDIARGLGSFFVRFDPADVTCI
jgi:hypothetical protein